MFFIAKNRFYKKMKLNHDRWMKQFIAMDGRDCALICESLLPPDDPLIANQRSRCVDEDVCILIRPLDFNPTIAIKSDVHRSEEISTIITRVIDGYDAFTYSRTKHV